MLHLSLWLRTLRNLFSLSLLVVTASTLPQTPAQGHTNRWYNADGSPKLALEFGGGTDIASGSSRQSLTHGWNYLMGGGYSFNRRISLLAEYRFNHFIAPQSEITALFGPQQTQPGTSRVVGDTHLWSLTLNPSYRYVGNEHLGLYVVGGGGFFRKLTIFRTSPNACINGNCGGPTSDLDRFSNNAGGLDIGQGISWRPGTYNNARLFLEARYTWVNNHPGTNSDFYPPANGATRYIPITAGFRW